MRELAALLREEDTPISAFVVDSEQPFVPAPDEAFAAAPDDYAFVIEAVREGYLLHYGTPRLLAGHDPDLALLAGDYLYALGIERLAEIGDSRAVLALAELISGCARMHAEGRLEEVAALWRRTVAAIDGASAAAGE